MAGKFCNMAVLIIGLCLVALLFTGCCLFDVHILDGPGMVNYNGILLDALIGIWNSDDGSYRLTVWDNYTLSISCNGSLLLEKATLTLHAASTNTAEYNELSISPNVLSDEAGGSVEIAKAYHENGTLTLELVAADGTEATIAFYREPEMLDGPGMVYEGGPLDEALTGCWYGADGRFVLDFEGKCADFSVDGKMLSSKDPGYYFVDHDFSAKDSESEE